MRITLLPEDIHKLSYLITLTDERSRRDGEPFSVDHHVKRFMRKKMPKVSDRYTVEPPIVDTPKSGQPPYNGQTACPLPTTVCMLEPLKKGQPLNNGKHSSPTCPLFGGSTVHVHTYIHTYICNINNFILECDDVMMM